MVIQNAVFRVVNVCTAFLTTLVISRLAGVEGYGLLSLMIVNAALFNLVTSFGADAGILYHAAAGTLSNRKIGKIIRWLLFIQLVALLIVELSSFYITDHFWLFRLYEFRQLWLVLLFLLSVSITEKYSALLNGLQFFSVSTGIQLAITLVMLACYIILLFAFPSYPALTYIIIYIILSSIQAIAFFIAFVKLAPSTINNALTKPEIRVFFGYSLITLITNSVQFFAYRVDYWILEYYQGEKALGWYSLAVKLVQSLWILPLVYAGILLPLVAASGRKFNSSGMLAIQRVIFYLNIFGGIILFISAEWIIPFFFGEEFRPSASLIRILVPGIILFGVGIVFASYFAGINRLRVNLLSSCLCLFVIIVLDFLLIPSRGMAGAALASSIGYAVAGIYFIVRVCLDQKISVGKIFFPLRNDWDRLRLGMTGFFSKK